MAILIDFRKVREDDQEVEYLFGFSEKVDRLMVIEKATQEATPTDGKADGEALRAFRAIVGYFQREAHWPERGAYSA